VVKNSSMKKIIIILIVIVLFVVAYKYYKYFEHSLVVGNPVFNENIDEAKKNKSFIYSYLQSDNYENIFDEVWLEKKAYISKKGIEKKDENLLKFSFANKIDTNLKVLDTIQGRKCNCKSRRQRQVVGSRYCTRCSTRRALDDARW
jgi:hypothetical protein